MKRTFIFLMAAFMALVSCTSTALDPLTGVFPDAQEPTLTTLTESSFEKTATNRLFTLKFSGSGATVEACLVGARNQYYLEPNVYGPGESNGCFLLGPTKINGNAVASGNITVQKKDNNIYKFIFVLFDGNGTPYRTKWEGELIYEPDPEPVVLTKLLVAQANTNGTVTFKVGTDDMDIDMMGSPTGNGFALTADVYSEDGYLHEGVYTPASGETVGPFQYAPGYEYDLSEWGMGIMHWGTCWWEGTKVTHINKEAITVEKKGTKFVITWGSEAEYPHWATFTGEIEALTPSAVPTPDYSYKDELSDPVDETFAPVAGVKTHNLTLFNAAGEEVAWFQLVLTEGNSDYSGDYLCKEYAHEDHTFGNGYDLSMWGMGMGGSRYLKNGDVVLINPGESLSVSRLAEDIWEITGNGFDFIFGTPADGPVEAAYTITDELSDPVDETFAPVAGVKTHNLTLKNAAGDECVWFQLVLTEGSDDFSGEYVCKEYAHEDHTFGNGYDLSMWGMGMGGTRYVSADGSVVLVNPGETLTITSVGDNTWKFTGSTGYEFVGKFE